MSSNDLRGADVLARRLVAAGCRYVFGIPGGEVLTLIDAFDRAGLRFSLVRHENAGGFMAEGTYHATGAPGVVLATVGPGVANLVNVVANAQQDRVPLVVVTGCLDASLTPSFSHQVFDHQAVLRPICKASFRLEPGAEATIADKALLIATTGRPGPVHLDVPMAVADGPASLRRWQPLPPPVIAHPDALAEARESIARAERPVVIVGNDVLHQGGEAKVRAILERLQLPVITTYKAKGVVDESEPYSLGAAGLSPKADAALLPYIAEADLVLLLGYDPIEMRAGWRDPFSVDATVVELSAVLDTQFVHHATHVLVGDVAANFQSLVATWNPPLRDAREIVEIRTALDITASEPSESALSAEGVTACLMTVPKATRITVDTGAHRILVSQKLRCSMPGLMHQSTGLCTMGCALPMAIGASLADPHRPTLALMGDGGFEMVIGELATARDLAVSFTAVVFDDRSLALIEKKQRERGLKNVGVDFGDSSRFIGTDYDAIAAGFGARGVTVTTAKAFSDALHRALAAPGVDVITCRLPRRDYDDVI